MIPFAEIDHTLIFSSVFLCIAMIFNRTLNAKLALGALVCACVFIVLDGHFWLGKVFLPRDKNPQIATVALMFITSTVMGLMVSFKRWRTLDRIMVCGASVSVLATFALFHYVLVQQVLPAWAKDAAWGNSFVLPVPKSGFQDACLDAGLLCWNGRQIASGALPQAYSQQIEGLYQFYRDHKPDGEVGHGLGVFNDLGEDGVSVVLYHQSGNDIRVVADSKTGLRIHSKVRDLFYLLASVAHSVWIFGALSLITFHRRRFTRRASSVD
uniref:Transmembrane protein n=2 Tax=Pseudomonas fluorescens TaxID=294 RepID=A0A0G4E445_PSEFS|nr:hypothetical protein PQBR57_0068 [Pseudomonas fluorescens SBW25]